MFKNRMTRTRFELYTSFSIYFYIDAFCIVFHAMRFLSILNGLCLIDDVPFTIVVLVFIGVRLTYFCES